MAYSSSSVHTLFPTGPWDLSSGRVSWFYFPCTRTSCIYCHHKGLLDDQIIYVDMNISLCQSSLSLSLCMICYGVALKPRPPAPRNTKADTCPIVLPSPLLALSFTTSTFWIKIAYLIQGMQSRDTCVQREISSSITLLHTGTIKVQVRS